MRFMVVNFLSGLRRMGIPDIGRAKHGQRLTLADEILRAIMRTNFIAKGTDEISGYLVVSCVANRAKENDDARRIPDCR